MMYEPEKSDLAIVAAKSANNPDVSGSESMEPRAGAKGSTIQQSTGGAQNRITVSQTLARARNVAKHRKKEQFTALFHHLSPDTFRTTFLSLKRSAAPGIDGMTWQDYKIGLDGKSESLHERGQGSTYHALPSWRQYIPKSDGRQRPLAIAALEDKIVQWAAAAVLNEFYETDFLGFSYGFRPKRSSMMCWMLWRRGLAKGT